MKQIILLFALTMTCEQVAFQGSSILRCYNDEAVCYIKQGIGGGISCILKEQMKQITIEPKDEE